MQSVKFKLENKDYVNFSGIVMRRLSSSKYFWIGWVVLIVVFAALVVAFENDYSITFYIGLIVAVLVWRYVHSRNVKYTDPKGSFTREQTFKILKDCIEIKSTVSFSSFKLEGILEIEQNKDYILYYIDTLQAVIIPKNSFSSSAKAEKFYNKSLELWKKKTGR